MSEFRQFLAELTELALAAWRWSVSHECEACGDRIYGSWSRARRLGWSYLTSGDGFGHVLCPECHELPERLPL